MRRAFAWITVVCLLFAGQGLAAFDLEYRAHKEAKPAGIRLNAYFFMHNLNEHTFRPLALRMNQDQILRSLNVIAANASYDAPAYVLVKKYRADQDLILTYRWVKIKEETALVVVTNFNIQKGELVEKPGGDEFAVLFYLKGDRLIYHQDIYSAEREEALKKQSPLSLANFYILDDRTENDSQIMPLLRQIEKDEKASRGERLVARMTQGQIGLINNDVDAARGIVFEVREAIQSMEPGLDRNIAEAVFAEFQGETVLLQAMLRPRAPAEKTEEPATPP